MIQPGSAEAADTAPLIGRNDLHRPQADVGSVAPRDDSFPSQWYWTAVVVVVLAGLALRIPTFTDGWNGVHNAWGGAFYSTIARNFLRYGFGATHFAPVTNTGVVDPSHFEIYYHHPVLTMWLTSVSFRIFGVQEWSARLAPLLFSLATMGLVVVMAREVFGRATALLALFFLAVVPVDVYYATHLDPYGSMAIFFTALTVEAYRRWSLTGRERHYALCAAAIVLGCMTSWFTYLVLPAIVAHGWLAQRSRWPTGMRLRLLALPAFAVLVFGFFMIHRQVAMAGARPELFAPLSERLLLRTVNLPLDRVEIATTYLRHIWWLYTPPFVLLTAAWVALSIWTFRRWKRDVGQWCVPILLSFGILYALVFPGHLPAHDYFVRTYAPGVAIACAIVVTRGAALLTSRLARIAFVAGVVVLTAAFAVENVRTLRAADGTTNGVVLRGFGEAVAALTAPRDPVFTPIRDDRVLSYYVDRPITFDLNTPEKLDSAATSARGNYLVIVPERNAEKFPEMLRHLRANYRERHDQDLFIFSAREHPQGTPR
jgi:4-amino-4-deoxy-L-arabinose transferase-like glycosyltransferase